MRLALAVTLLVALSFGDAAVAAPKPDRTPPVIRSAIAQGANITLSYSESLDPRAGPPSAFEVLVNGVSTNVRSVAVQGRQIRVRLARSVWSDDAVTIAPSERVRDRAGNRARFSRLAARNASPVGCSPGLAGKPSGVSEALRDPETTLSGVGKLRIAILFADFADAPGDESLPELYDQLLPPTTAFFRTSSFGRLSIETVFLPRWLRISAASRTIGAGGQMPIVLEAIRAADPFFDFSGIDAVEVVLSRDGSTAASAYLPDFAPTIVADGTRLRFSTVIGNAALGNEPTAGAREPNLWRVIVHETAHLLGLPDLYQTLPGESLEPVGSWDPMASPELAQDFLAWHKLKLGWFDPPQLRCLRSKPVEATLTPVTESGQTAAIAVRLSNDRALVVEARRRRGCDAALCSDGVLVYEVDASTSFQPITVRHAKERGVECSAPYAVGTSYRGDGVLVKILAEVGDGYRVRVSRQ